MSNNILIIAGGGFLGKSLIASFKKNNFGKIGCIDVIDPAIDDVKFYQINMLETSDEALLNVINNYDIIVNCLGQVTNPINLCFRLNSEGINKVVNAVKATNKFLIHFSTVTVYGSCNNADEHTAVNPETSYSCAKAFAEYLIESNLHIDNYCIVRLSNLYGEQQPKGVFSYIKRSFNSDKLLEFNNDGYMVRYYLHVQDCAEAISNIISKSVKGKYNLIGPDKYSLRQLTALAENIMHTKFEISFNQTPSWDNTLDIKDNKLRESIDLTYRHSIENSLKLMFSKQ
jgi:nucleoside-diphosphate-sugar epimerase